MCCLAVNVLHNTINLLTLLVIQLPSISPAVTSMYWKEVGAQATNAVAQCEILQAFQGCHLSILQSPLRLGMLSFFSVFLAGVLLDIQQHFGVKDSGAGLLQTGKSLCFLSVWVFFLSLGGIL